MDSGGGKRSFLRASAPGFALDVLVNVALPFAIYDLTKDRLGDVRALLWSSAPPIVASVVQFAWKRRVDAVSMLVLAGIALSLLAFAGGGSVRYLQLRENLVTGVIGVVFLASATIGKPLIYELARAGMRRGASSDVRRFESLKDNRYFKHSMTVMTLVWGFGLLAQTALACALVFAMPIATYLIVGPIVGYGAMGALALWTFWYARRARRLGEARRAAAALSEDGA